MGCAAMLGGGTQDRDAVFAEVRGSVRAMVDAGTVELVRGLGVEVVSSANLIQYFESRWSAEQLEMHLEAGAQGGSHSRRGVPAMSERSCGRPSALPNGRCSSSSSRDSPKRADDGSRAGRRGECQRVESALRT